MTNTDKVVFVQSFNRLAVACRLSAKEADPSMQLIYFQGLQDLSIEAVAAGAQILEKSAQWFPKVSEWRSAAKIQHIAHIKALPPGREAPWEDECGACADTGWEERRCYPGTPNICGHKACKRDGRAEHLYVQPCTCRPTNRTYQRHHVLKDRETYAE
jgi:hypothetical protein